jgi:hypothetical protein
MAALNREEADFIRSLRRMLAKGGSLSTQLVSEVAPIAPVAQKTTPTFVAEPTTGPWHQSSSWGTSVDLTRKGYPIRPDILGVIQSIKLPGPPRCRTIVLNRDDVSINSGTPGIGTGAYFQVVARIRAGVGGGIVETLVDWSNAIVNVTASTLEIDAIFRSPNGEDILYTNETDVGGNLVVAWGGKLTVQIGADPSAFNGDNTLTQTTQPVLVGQTRYLPIPVQASAFSLYAQGTNLAVSNDLITFHPQQVVTGTEVIGSIGAVPLKPVIEEGLRGRTSLPGAAQSISYSTNNLAGLGALIVVWYLNV